MVAVRKTITVCNRCAFRREREATATRTFSVDELYYQLKLCEEHATMFDRDIAGWTRLATDIDPPAEREREQSRFFNSERKAELARLRELQEAAAAKARAERAAAARLAEIDQQESPPQLDADAQLQRAFQYAWATIPNAPGWTVTDHARERMMERGFTPYEMLAAAATPEIVVPSQVDPATRVHAHGRCSVVVNPETKTIITVTKSKSEDAERNGARTAPPPPSVAFRHAQGA